MTDAILIAITINFFENFCTIWYLSAFMGIKEWDVSSQDRQNYINATVISKNWTNDALNT